MKDYFTGYKMGILLIATAFLAALAYFIVFDHSIATSPAGFTDGASNSPFAFNAPIDLLCLGIILGLVLFGSYFNLSKLERKWLRIILAIITTFTALLVFNFIYYQIQIHVSGFRGV